MDSKHYKDVATHYDAQVFYDTCGPLVQWQRDLVMSKLQLSPGDKLVDVGGGTGGFTHLLAKEMLAAGDLDPSVTLLAGCFRRAPRLGDAGERRTRTEPSMQTMHGSAVSMVQVGMEFNKVLLKEVIHHLDAQERMVFLHGLWSGMPPGGRVLIVTRPQYPAYPFPEAAREEWAAHQEPHSVFEEQLRGAGFEVEVSTESFPLTMPKAAWNGMLQGKVWSTFAHFSDEKLSEWVQQLDIAHPGPVFSFSEVEIFVVGVKPGGAAA
ncbi:unnamed protein product [Polarella glacialis]|uniref:Methyltransferase domain-containing protein n=1 Tax=Polarella glacialis TaxID=89957 RepID=A0A813KG28_POLGL|nr:unnamed protein product [Polarella glacialis]